MPLFETIKIDQEKVKKIIKNYWNLELGKCLKESQNHTFESTDCNQNKFIVRVTPDPQKQRIECTELETKLLEYLSNNNLSVCKSIPNQVDGKSMVVIDDLVICVFEYSKGEPINYIEWKWLETPVVQDLGRWYGKLHKLVRSFVKEHPEEAKKARMWNTLHDGILSGVPIDEKDKEIAETDSNHFTIIHGDVNPSNYFWSSEKGISMFDWDQLQISWLNYDLSSSIFGVWVLERKGSPIDGAILPQFNHTKYMESLLETYESEIGEKVDRDSLLRMIEIRKQLYIRFCKAAIHELSPDSPMYAFCKGMNDFFEKENSNKE